MYLSDISIQAGSDTLQLQATVHSPTLNEPFLLWYRLPAAVEPFVATSAGNALVAAMLLPAMKAGEPIELPLPISPRFARALRRIQTIFQIWEPTLTQVEIRAPLREAHLVGAEDTGLFFSLGVDSFYSLIKNATDHPLNEHQIHSLIVVYGADIYPSDGKQHVFDAMVARATEVAQTYNRTVTPVATNVKDLLRAYQIGRGFIGHGTALASVGLALEGLFSNLYCSTGLTYDDIQPSGNHPLLDPLWSTETCTFVHDGLEATRLEKTRYIAQSQVALDTLRVCWAKERPEYNCGQCSKCIRTMLSLYVVGKLGQCHTLPATLSLKQLRNLPLLHGYEDETYFQPLLQQLGDSEQDAVIRDAIQVGLNKGRLYFGRLEQAKQQLNQRIPAHQSFILVDQDSIRPELGIGRRVLPFLERDGQYYGLPADDATAIRELERLRSGGASAIVFWWCEFWWLDYYAGLNQYLRAHYPCVLSDDSLIVFDLRGSARA